MATLNTVTSSTRPASPAAGEAYFETDTNKIIVWTGSEWTEIVSDTVPSFSNTYSVDFDGTNDIITLDSTESFSGEFTFSTWINLSSLSGIEVWFGALTGGFTYMFYLSGTVYYRTEHGALTLSQSVSWSTGEWHHVMITRNSSNLITMFIDGASVKTGTNSDTLTLNSFGQTTYPFNGLIDEYAIWNSDQSANISSIYNSGVPSDLTSYSPVGWWRMGDDDSGTGTTITDQGSGSNDGTLTNGPTFSSDVPS